LDTVYNAVFNSTISRDEIIRRETLHWPGSSRRLDPVSGGWGSFLVPCSTTDQFFSVPDTGTSRHTRRWNVSQ